VPDISSARGRVTTAGKISRAERRKRFSTSGPEEAALSGSKPRAAIARGWRRRCLCGVTQGTRIATQRGGLPVECPRTGAMATTADGRVAKHVRRSGQGNGQHCHRHMHHHGKLPCP
jgi:hypothetical protein